MRGRWLALAVIAGVTTGLASQLPRLEMALTPESIVTPPADRQARFEDALGPLPEAAPAMLLLVEGHDPLDLPSLDHAHRAARAFQARPWVRSVDALSVTPLPRTPGGAGTSGLTLAALDQEEEDEGAQAREDRLADVLGAALATDPTRFPMGLASLRPPLEWGPLVGGPTVIAPDRARMQQALVTSPWLRRRLVDEAGRTAVVVISPRDGLDPQAQLDAAEELTEWVAENPAPAGARQRLAGLPIARLALLSQLADDQVRLPALAVLASALLLLLTLRTRAGVGLPLAAAGMTCAATMGAMAVAGQPVDLLTNVVPPLLITLGLGDAVHLFVRYREELAHAPPLEAARRTFVAMRRACFATSLTTAVGFGSLAVGGSPALVRFGVVAALGVMAAYVVTVGALPAMLPEAERDAEEPGDGLGRLTVRIAGWARRRRWPVIGVSLVLLAAGLGLGARVRVDASLLDPLDPDGETVRTARWVEEELDGYRVMDVAVAGPEGAFRTAAGMARLGAIERWLSARPEVLRVDGAPSRLPPIWGRLARGQDGEALATDARVAALLDLAAVTVEGDRWVSEDGAHARLEVRLADRGEASIAALADAVETRLGGELEGGLGDVVVITGGEAATSARGLTQLTVELGWSLLLALAITFLLLGVTLRSARLGLISVLPNVLPLALAIGWMGLLDRPLHASSAIVFTISLGLAVDGTIHVLSRYREELSRGAADPIARAMRGSGRAVTIGVGTLLAGFGVLLFASFQPIQRFAELALIALGSAFVCELVLVPALLEVFGPRTDQASAR